MIELVVWLVVVSIGLAVALVALQDSGDLRDYVERCGRDDLLGLARQHLTRDRIRLVMHAINLSIGLLALLDRLSGARAFHQLVAAYVPLGLILAAALLTLLSLVDLRQRMRLREEDVP